MEVEMNGNKYGKVLLTVILAMLLVISVVVGCDRKAEPVEGDFSAQAVGLRPLVPYLAYYEETLSADKWVILIDLSDRANYPHVHTSRIILKSLRYAGDLNAAKRWRWEVGVVTAVTTATTDIEWIAGGERVTAVEFDERWQLPEHGLSLSVVGGSLDRVATLEVVSTSSVTSTTELSTTVGVTGTVGVGDLILHTDEITNTGLLHFTVSAGYDTE